MIGVLGKAPIFGESSYSKLANPLLYLYDFTSSLLICDIYIVSLSGSPLL